MRPFFHLLSHLKSYKLFLACNIACNVLMVLFSVVSIPAVIPFLNILLDQQPMVAEAPEQQAFRFVFRSAVVNQDSGVQAD